MGLDFRLVGSRVLAVAFMVLRLNAGPLSMRSLLLKILMKILSVAEHST